MNAEWKKAHAFAEIAETLGVRTDQILAAIVNPGMPAFAAYTTDADETLLFTQLLARDADGILVRLGEPTARPGAWEEIARQIEEGL